MADAIEFGMKSLNGRADIIATGIDAVTKQQSKTSNEMMRILDTISNMKDQVRKLLKEQDYVTSQYKRVDKIVLNSKPDDYVIHEYQPVAPSIRVTRKSKSPTPEMDTLSYQSDTPMITITTPSRSVAFDDELFDDKKAVLGESKEEQVPQSAVKDTEVIEVTTYEEEIETEVSLTEEVSTVVEEDKTDIREEGSHSNFSTQAIQIEVATDFEVTGGGIRVEDDDLPDMPQSEESAAEESKVISTEDATMGNISEQESMKTEDALLLEEEEALLRKEEEEELRRLKLEALKEEEEELARLEEDALRKEEEELARIEDDALRKEEEELARLEEETLRKEEEELARLEEETLRKEEEQLMRLEEEALLKEKEEEELARLEEEALRKEEEELVRLEEEALRKEEEELVRLEEEALRKEEEEELENNTHSKDEENKESAAQDTDELAKEEARKKEEEEKTKKAKFPPLKKSPGKLVNKFQQGGKNRVIFK